MSDDRAAAMAVNPVIREDTFVRIAADITLFAFLGRDIEGAFIARSNDIVGIGATEDGRLADIANETRLVEMARIRMAPETAFTALQNLYMVLRTHGLVEEEAMREALAVADRTIAAQREAPNVQ